MIRRKVQERILNGFCVVEEGEWYCVKLSDKRNVILRFMLSFGTEDIGLQFLNGVRNQYDLQPWNRWQVRK